MSKEQEFDDLADLDKALDEFDNNELNLTNEQKDSNLKQSDDPEYDAKVMKEYEEFMNQMKNLGMNDNNNQGAGQDQGMEQLTNMLGGLLKNLTEESGLQEGENSMGGGFEDMFKSLQSDNIEEAAGKLLNQFMNKDLLYEPLVETKENYEQYFKKQEGKISETDLERFQKQYTVIQEILAQLGTDPIDKQKLIELFEKMQEYGAPPDGIVLTNGLM